LGGKVSIAFSYDGTTCGKSSFVYGGFKLLESQDSDDVLITIIFIGKDTKINSIIHFGYFFRWVEQMTKEKIVEIDNYSYEIDFHIVADLKALWALYDKGSKL